MNSQWPEAARLRADWEASRNVEALLGGCLAALVEKLNADRAIVFLGHGSGTTSPWRGRDRDGALASGELEESSRTLVERCIAEAKVVTWDSQDNTQLRSAAELKLLAAVAVPIGRPVRGALYVDFRRLRYVRAAAHTGVFEEVAALLAEAITPTDFKPPARPATSEASPPDLDALLTLPGLFAMTPVIRMAVGNVAPVLILGETGTGKTLLADALARRIQPKDPTRVMLGTSNDHNTVVAELFGVVKNWSPNVGEREGVVESAHKGVLIFDEVLNLPLAVQPLLLDFIQFGTFRPLGHKGAKPKHVDVRMIAVTNGDLEGAVRDGKFREDLYHRLAGTIVRIPPLRDRRGDIPGLAAILLPRIAPGETWRLSLAARRALVSERLLWSGNVRQFEGLLRRAVERARQNPDGGERVITDEHLDAAALVDTREWREGRGTKPLSDADFRARWEALQARQKALTREEDDLILEAWEARDKSKIKASEALGFAAPTTFNSRFKRIQSGRARGEAAEEDPTGD
jgi:transcriptional regulator with GAF, ATPase, and Fis domain